jgi:hypothetical protein
LLEQGVPHAEQFAALESTLISQPSLGSPLQSAQPELHDAILQTPSEQAGVAWFKAQTFAQPPQFDTSEFVFTSHPSVALVLQFAAPPTHCPSLHTPAWQKAAPFVNSHIFPHAPQFEASLCVLTSHPVLASWSQSA